MELSLLSHQLHPLLLHCPLTPNFLTRTQKRIYNKTSNKLLQCSCSQSSSNNTAVEPITMSLQIEGRRALLTCLLTTFAGVYACDVTEAVSTSRRALRGAKIPESDYKTLPNGLKYYDLKVGDGAEAVKGSRVAIHYVAKWRGITFMTSRQGMGVGGGTVLPYIDKAGSSCYRMITLEENHFLDDHPYGFDVGESKRGNVLKGLDLGVEGMRVGGQRLLLVPPELAYGSRGVQEIPPNATIEMDVELLAIKQSPFGTAVKIVEG